MITSIGIFSLMMVTIAGIFRNSISSFRSNRVIERNLENAQFVMNEMAKELRTSTVLGTVVDGTFTSGAGTVASPYNGSKIKFYDYSQSLCLEYQYDGTTAIRKRSNTVGTFVAATLENDCTTALATASWAPVTTGYTLPSFIVVKSTDGAGNSANAVVGRVTIVFVVKEKAAATQSVTLQTTVSLRDYVRSGIVH